MLNRKTSRFKHTYYLGRIDVEVKVEVKVEVVVEVKVKVEVADKGLVQPARDWPGGGSPAGNPPDSNAAGDDGARFCQSHASFSQRKKNQSLPPPSPRHTPSSIGISPIQKAFNRRNVLPPRIRLPRLRRALRSGPLTGRRAGQKSSARWAMLHA